MRRILLLLIVVCMVGVLIFWTAVLRRSEKFRGNEDLRDALAVMKQIQNAETRCYQAHGEYAGLRDLPSCGKLDQRLAQGSQNGFTAAVEAHRSNYSVSVLPMLSKRFHSLYSDQTGVVRFGSPSRPATADSTPIGGR
jgi:hypothetical protein